MPPSRFHTPDDGGLDVPAPFRRFVREAGPGTDLLEAALALDRAFLPSVDPDAVRRTVEELAAAYARAHPAGEESADRLHALGHFFRERLAGVDARDAGADVAFLSAALDERRGLPVTLAVIYTAVGQRTGVPVVPLELPGHFIVGLAGAHGGPFLDPFRHGRVLTPRTCDRLVAAATGGRETSAEPYRSPAPVRRVLRRIACNVQAVAWHAGDDRRGLLAARVRAVLSPDDADPLRARAHVYDRMGDVPAALVDYEAYLRRAPGAPDAEAVRRRIERLRDRTAT